MTAAAQIGLVDNRMCAAATISAEVRCVRGDRVAGVRRR
jgi:hypothetical protein